MNRKTGYILILQWAAVIALCLAFVRVYERLPGPREDAAQAEAGASPVQEAQAGGGIDSLLSTAPPPQAESEPSGSMHVHVWSVLEVDGDTVSVGFENSEGNTYDQAFRIIQDGAAVYESYPVAPGDGVQDVTCPDIRVGKAIVEVFSVVDGASYGNGVRLEVAVVGRDSEGGHADRAEDYEAYRE